MPRMYRLVLLPGLHKWARPGALENNPHHRGCPSDRWEPLSFQITGATADGRIRDPKVIKDLRVRETTARHNHQKECDALATHSKGAPPSHAACSKNWASSADRRGGNSPHRCRPSFLSQPPRSQPGVGSGAPTPEFRPIPSMVSRVVQARTFPGVPGMGDTAPGQTGRGGRGKGIRQSRRISQTSSQS